MLNRHKELNITRPPGFTENPRPPIGDSRLTCLILNTTTLTLSERGGNPYYIKKMLPYIIMTQPIPTIDELYQEYLTQLAPPAMASPSQIKVLSEMYKSNTDIQRLQKYSEILGKPISDYSQLTHQHCKTLFKYHQDHQPLTKTHLKTILPILTKLNWNQISTQLEKPVTDITDLTRIDYDRLIRKNPWFNLSEALDNFQNRPVDHIITSNTVWEYGWQRSPVTRSGKLHYLKFYDWMMLDYDQDKLLDVRQRIEPYLTKDSSLLFYVYQTFRGYHLHLMSATKDHYSYTNMKWMYSLGSDVWYILFTYRNGYRVRLTPKLGENSDTPMYTQVDTWGNGKLDPQCEEYHHIYLNFLHQSKIDSG